MEQNLDILFFKERLAERLLELSSLAETGDAAAKPVELDQTRVGRLSRMDAMQAQAMSMETKRRREGEVLRINAALERINNGRFGNCLECDEPISTARLNSDPSTLLCIICAESRE
ncbi:MAG: molecular chaperone DnaK [marine bacterium B5-7]|nr:MAG: molecular chaperone DnaK [marine bacterium B5-7]